MDYKEYKQKVVDEVQMAKKKKKKKKPHFRSKEAKWKYEAYKHMHVPGCGK